jgi:hypothetical protein
MDLCLAVALAAGILAVLFYIAVLVLAACARSSQISQERGE